MSRAPLERGHFESWDVEILMGTVRWKPGVFFRAMPRSGLVGGCACPEEGAVDERWPAQVWFTAVPGYTARWAHLERLEK